MDDRYYYGLNPDRLTHNEYWLIVIIQAASYCELRHVDYIRYSQLKTISDELLRTINKRRLGLGGGSFESILKTCSTRRFLRVEKVSQKETRIYPNIPLIKREVEAKKIENLDYNNKIIRTSYRIDPYPRSRGIFESSIKVSAVVGRVVTRANEKETTKQSSNSIK